MAESSVVVPESFDIQMPDDQLMELARAVLVTAYEQAIEGRLKANEWQEMTIPVQVQIGVGPGGAGYDPAEPRLLEVADTAGFHSLICFTCDGFRWCL